MSVPNNPTASGEQVPVLIVGGGLVGLSTAMFLVQHGIASVAIERLRGVLALPRAAHFHLRTLELFRTAGIEDEVRRQSEREFTPEDAIVALESLAGKQTAAFIPSLNEGVEALSRSRRLFITQPGLEPILRACAEQAGATVLDGSELIAVARRWHPAHDGDCPGCRQRRRAVKSCRGVVDLGCPSCPPKATSLADSSTCAVKR
jgi:2-polyprenyl-6-methoxyphenol hydroxylase-like FAD-dependent oxidoreductase